MKSAVDRNTDILFKTLSTLQDDIFRRQHRLKILFQIIFKRLQNDRRCISLLNLKLYQHQRLFFNSKLVLETGYGSLT